MQTLPGGFHASFIATLEFEMSNKIDLSVAETWCSKLCHDLISPVGAVCNGVEFLQDPSMCSVDEASELIAHSAGMAADRLSFYRAAYGASGSQIAMSLNDARQTADAYLKWTKVNLSVPEGGGGAVFPAGLGKVFLNLIVLLESALPYGGEIAVELTQAQGGEDVEGFTLRATGRRAEFTHGEAKALSGDVALEDISPKSVHAYMTGQFARRLDKLATVVPGGESTLQICLE